MTVTIKTALLGALFGVFALAASSGAASAGPSAVAAGLSAPSVVSAAYYHRPPHRCRVCVRWGYRPCHRRY